MSWYLAAKVLESSGVNYSSERSWGYGNISVRTSVIANQQIFAHLSYPFFLPCVSLKQQVP